MAERTEKDRARSALTALRSIVGEVKCGLNEAPYIRARVAMQQIDEISDIVAAELGVEIVGDCEHCGDLVLFGDDYIPTEDAGPLCSDCRPSDDELRAMAATEDRDA